MVSYINEKYILVDTLIRLFTFIRVSRVVEATAVEIKFKNKVNYVLYASPVTEYFDVILMRCNTHKPRSQIDQVKNNLLNFFKCSAMVGAAF